MVDRLRIAFISSAVPRRCGIATFTSDLVAAVDRAQLALCDEITPGRDYREVHLSAHRMLGDVMRESVGEHSLVATDLLRGLPEAFRRTREAAEEKSVHWSG